MLSPQKGEIVDGNDPTPGGRWFWWGFMDPESPKYYFCPKYKTKSFPFEHRQNRFLKKRTMRQLSGRKSNLFFMYVNTWMLRNFNPEPYRIWHNDAPHLKLQAFLRPTIFAQIYKLRIITWQHQVLTQKGWGKYKLPYMDYPCMKQLTQAHFRAGFRPFNDFFSESWFHQICTMTIHTQDVLRKKNKNTTMPEGQKLLSKMQTCCLKKRETLYCFETLFPTTRMRLTHFSPGLIWSMPAAVKMMTWPTPRPPFLSCQRPYSH